MSAVTIPSIDQAEHRRRALNARWITDAALLMRHWQQASTGRDVCSHEELLKIHQRMCAAITELEALE